MEELRLQELRHTRELNSQKEEIKYLKSVISEQERTIGRLEEEAVRLNNVLLPPPVTPAETSDQKF